MRAWFTVALLLGAALSPAFGAPAAVRPPEADRPDRPLHELAGWCTATGSAGPCGSPSLVALRTDPRTLWRGTCADPDHGSLEVVGAPTGYGGTGWYFFDAAGALVAFHATPDDAVYSDAARGVSFGFEATCVGGTIDRPVDRPFYEADPAEGC
ncbi:MAG: hypothetical protein ABMB14_26120 [Myxococcota bacterium]